LDQNCAKWAIVQSRKDFSGGQPYRARASRHAGAGSRQEASTGQVGHVQGLRHLRAPFAKELEPEDPNARLGVHRDLSAFGRGDFEIEVFRP
jgi:hypothetical protein